jgi:hypothetical protein
MVELQAFTRKIKEVSSDDRHTDHGVRAGAADDMLLRNDYEQNWSTVYCGGWLPDQSVV